MFLLRLASAIKKRHQDIDMSRNSVQQHTALFDRHTSVLTNIGMRFLNISWWIVVCKGIGVNERTLAWNGTQWRAAHDRVHSPSLPPPLFSFHFIICKLFFGRSSSSVVVAVVAVSFFGVRTNARIINCEWSRMLKGKIAHWRKIIGSTCSCLKSSLRLCSFFRFFCAFFFI